MSEAPVAVRRFHYVAVVAFALASLAAVAAVAGTAWLAGERRADLVRFATGSGLDYRLHEKGLRYLVLTHLAETLALLSWPVLGGVLVYLWAKETSGGWRRFLPVLVVGLVPLSALLTLAICDLVHYSQLPGLGHEGENLSYAQVQAIRYKALLLAFGVPPFAWLAATTVAAAVALLGVAAVNLVPRAVSAGRSQYLISGAILALGLAAFAATRAHAHDAARPLPLWQPENYAPRLVAPTIQHCDRDSVSLEAIIIEVTASGEARLDWEVREPGELATMLRGKRKLWQDLNPGRPAPTRIILALAPSLDRARARPIVAATREAGFSDVYEARILPPRTWPSRTLGAVPFQPRGCAVPLGH